MEKEITDILIIGAGPSGTVAAGYLQQQNASVLVVEKQKFPRYTIGESLIPRCMDNFDEAGFLDVLNEQNYQKKHGARFLRKDEESIFDFSKKFGEGWDWTWQVPRDHFDQVLAEDIQKRGIPVWFDAMVSSVKKESDYWSIEIEYENEIRIIEAKFIIDSSGNGRVLANQLGLEAPPKIYDHSSIFTQIKEKNRPEGLAGEQISFEILNQETWFWYIPFSNGNSSLGFVGPNKWFKQFSKDPTLAFYEMLKESKLYKGRFDDYEFLFRPIQMKNVSKNVKAICGDGFALTGNSAEFLDPVFSSGVAFATESGLLAAKLAFKELQGNKVDWQADYSEYMQSGVDVFATYVEAWYNGKLQKIFFAKNQNEQIKAQICAVLAGYVWDRKNPFVRNHKRMLENVSRLAD